jgi:hypothetical protein
VRIGTRGGISDFAVIGAVFFIVLTMAVVGVFVFSSAQGLGLGAAWDGTMATLEGSFIMLGVGLLFFLFVGMIAAAYLASQVGSSPALIVIGILLLLPIVLFAAGMSAGWTDIATGPMAAAAASIPYVNDVMNNFVVIVLFGSAVLLLALYAGYRVHGGAG